MPSREAAIKNLLTRNVEKVIERDHLERALKSGKKLRVKLGIDPTSPDLHLGHAVVLRKLREFQGLGHKAVLIIGDFTAQIGDPSGKSKTRQPLTERQVKINLKTFLKQAKLVVDVKKAEVRHNSEWLGALRGAKLMQVLSAVSIQQVLEREDFAKRFASHESIRGHELLYPVMQAYDSVAVKADVELGGRDQTLNLLMGRQLMSRLGMEPQDILTTSLLEGLGGTEKMSKSLGNYVALTDSPGDMFGKLMSMRDEVIEEYERLATNLEPKKFANPKERKERLAKEIVRMYHGEKAAEGAKEKWEKLFSKKDFSNVEIKTINGKKWASPVELVLKSGVAKSNSEARRLVIQGAVEINGEAKKDPQEAIILRGGELIKIGKRHFFRVRV